MRVKRIITLFLMDDDTWDGVDTELKPDGQIERVTKVDENDLYDWVNQRLYWGDQ